MRKRLAIAVLASTCGIVGCAQLLSLDEVTYAAADSGALDATTGDVSVAAPDAQAPPDAQAHADGAGMSDATPDGCTLFCTGDAAIFADDFDEDATPSARWSKQTGPLNASMTLDSDASVSAPNALFVTTLGVPEAKQAGAYLEEQLTPSLTAVQVAFDVRLEALGAPSLDIAQIGIGEQSNLEYIGVLEVQPTSTVLNLVSYHDGISSTEPVTLSSKLTSGSSWKKVRLIFVLHPSDGGTAALHVSIYFDDVRVLDSDSTPSDVVAASHNVTVLLGAFSSSSAPAATASAIRFDNFRVDGM